MNEDEFRYCHHDDADEYRDCLDYMGCEECSYYYADLDWESDYMTIDEAKGFIQGKLDCMKKCNVFEREHSYNTDLF